MSKNSITVRVPEHWDKLPRDVVESPFLEIFKTYLKAILSTYCRESALAGDWYPEVPSNPCGSLILWLYIFVAQWKTFGKVGRIMWSLWLTSWNRFPESTGNRIAFWWCVNKSSGLKNKFWLLFIIQKLPTEALEQLLFPFWRQRLCENIQTTQILKYNENNHFSSPSGWNVYWRSSNPKQYFMLNRKYDID